MGRKRMIRWVVGIPLLVAVLITIIVLQEPEKEGMNRAMAAKSVALLFQSPEELSTWRQEQQSSFFQADAQSEWYISYMDYLYENGFLMQEETPPNESSAEGKLTYQEAARIAENIDPELKKMVMVTKKNQDKPYPEESWWLLYDSFLKKADLENVVQKRSILVYGTPENIPGTEAWTAYTNLGKMKFTGISMDYLIDHQAEVYVRDEEILHICQDLGTEVEYRNVWLADGETEALEVYVGDITRRIPFKKKMKKVESLLGNLADIQLKDGKIVKVSVKKERITGKVLSVQEDGVEIEGYGLLPMDDEFQILKTYGELQRQTLDDILVGYDMQEFVVAKGKICAVLTVRSFSADTIRVLLMNENFKELYHANVSLQCPAPMTLVQGEYESEISAGEVLDYTHGDSCFADGRVILVPQQGEEITVRSMKRSQGYPAYGGRLELIDTDNGLILINELYLEDYLKKVVPSEMPSSYEKEALKAQAVCARTYAYMQLQSNTYSEYGAHVDDSTNFQVYNNIETSTRTTEAVQETYGKMLLYDGSPVAAYYYSTSCGTTTDGSVWGGDGTSTPYLKAVTLQPGRRTLDITSNTDFAAFIKNQEFHSYDADYPFFRWSVVTDAEILTRSIGGVGTVQNLEITERGPGGVAKTMNITGSDGNKTISGQNAIRSALGDESLVIRCKDGNTVTGWNSLPSGFIAVEAVGKTENGVQQFKIYGGGFGHGAGMSQNGAQGMAKSGMNYTDILKFFYDGVTVSEMR
ncbi:MAG: SpoIID/LytB domain-containing protein [Brotaphodocola sp.]